MDDFQISHINPKAVTSIINALSKEYADIMPLSVSRRKVHGYLGMVFDYATDGQVLVQMYQYIQGVINGAPEMYKTGIGSATPAPSHLYEVRDPEK